jgi:hypothetical protein
MVFMTKVYICEQQREFIVESKIDCSLMQLSNNQNLFRITSLQIEVLVPIVMIF